MKIQRSFGARAVFAAALAIGVLSPSLGRAAGGDQPVEMPSPIPTPTPNTSPLPYPAYGSPAPDVEQLTPAAGVPAIVTLLQSEKIAVALSPAFAAENAQWAAIHAKYTSEREALFPGVSGTASLGKSYENLSANAVTTPGPFATGSNATSYQASAASAGITIQQLIFDGGRTIAAIRSAKEADVAGRGTLVRNLQTLQLNVADAFFAVLEDNATVVADAQLVREFEVNEDSVRAQIRNGVAARSDLAAAQYQTAQAKGELVTAQGTAIGAQATFATTLGLDADAEVVPQQIQAEASQSNPTYAASLKKALILRPDYLAAAYTLFSSQDNLRYAKLARVPLVLGVASDLVTRSEYPSQNSVPSYNAFTNSKALGLQATVPIYDQGETNYNVAVAATQVDEAKDSLIQTKLQVESDVRSALANLISARANLVQARAEQEAAQVSLDATQAQYKVGATTILDLVTAEANLSTAAASYIAGLYGVRTAEQSYLYATGASDLQL